MTAAAALPEQHFHPRDKASKEPGNNLADLTLDRANTSNTSKTPLQIIPLCLALSQHFSSYFSTRRLYCFLGQLPPNVRSYISVLHHHTFTRDTHEQSADDKAFSPFFVTACAPPHTARRAVTERTQHSGKVCSVSQRAEGTR